MAHFPASYVWWNRKVSSSNTSFFEGHHPLLHHLRLCKHQKHGLTHQKHGLTHQNLGIAVGLSVFAGGPRSAGVVPPHAPRRAEGKGGASSRPAVDGGWWMGSVWNWTDSYHLKWENDDEFVDVEILFIFRQPDGGVLQEVCGIFSPANPCNNGMINWRT